MIYLYNIWASCVPTFKLPSMPSTSIDEKPHRVGLSSHPSDMILTWMGSESQWLDNYNVQLDRAVPNELEDWVRVFYAMLSPI